MLFVTTLLIIIALPMEALAVTDKQCEINVLLLKDISEIVNCVFKTKSSLGISSQTYEHYVKWDYIVPARQAGEA